MFEKRLRKQDPMLSVKWFHRDKGGRLKDRYAILRKQPSQNRLYDRYWLVMWVQNDDGSFRPLDQRTLIALKKADNHTRGERAIIDELIGSQEREQEAQRKAGQSDLRDAAKDLPYEKLAKIAEEDGIGTPNVPKEDIEAALTEQYGAETLETFA
jgi:hypothetical protein